MADISTLLPKIIQILGESGSTITKVIQDLMSGNFSQDDLNKLKNLLQPVLNLLNGQFRTAGIVAGAEAGFIIKYENLNGILLDASDGFSPYRYEYNALSLGASEGIDGCVGIIIATENPTGMSGVTAFADAGISAVGGVAVKASTDGEYLILFNGGEDVDLSVGVGTATVAKL